MYDVAIVGGGILGLATGRELLSRTPGLQLLLLEKEHRPASHQSTNNSGVIHSGIYYRPGSLRADLSRRGATLLREYCSLHAIPYRRTGKLVVAVDERELPLLDDLRQRAADNGVAAVALLSADGIRQHEPNCTGLRALYVPETSVIDYGAVAATFADEIARAGGTIVTDAAVLGSERRDGAVALQTATQEFEAKRVVACAGLGSDGVARALGGASFPRVEPIRGEFLVLRPELGPLVNACIYPVPNPRFPFLGAHVTPRIDGSIWFGPSDIAQPDVLAAVQRFIPSLQASDTLPGPLGIRAQGVDERDCYVDDFAFERSDRIVQVRNAPSPAATSCLAIAQHVADLLSAAE